MAMESFRIGIWSCNYERQVRTILGGFESVFHHDSAENLSRKRDAHLEELGDVSVT